MAHNIRELAITNRGDDDDDERTRETCRDVSMAKQHDELTRRKIRVVRVIFVSAEITLTRVTRMKHQHRDDDITQAEV